MLSRAVALAVISIGIGVLTPFLGLGAAGVAIGMQAILLVGAFVLALVAP